ncbi:MAG: molybdopterin synthase sulfur carrier subunit [Rhodospirillaceae bacterium]|nr:MAG: molybdopterin synthase sulfur carrier subunit [Rhodospirillaceae bacterium]
MKLLYFAWIRTNLGVSEELVDVPSEINDVRGLLDWLINRGESYKAAFSDLNLIRVAVNQEYVDLDHAITTGDEIAFFPPVTGG